VDVTTDAGVVASRPVGFEALASRATSAAPGALRRIPFTGSVVLVTLAIGLLTGTAFSPIAAQSWYPDVAYGVPALRDGQLWTFVTGWFFATHPVRLLGGLLLFGLLVGACELRIGTRRTALSATIGQLGGLLVACGLTWLLAGTGWTWAHDLSMAREVGFSAGALAVVAVTSATLRSPWRLRVRAALWLFVTVAFLFQGSLNDVAGAVAAGFGLLLGQRYLGVEPGFGPRTRRETRLLAFGGLMAVLATEVVVLLWPGEGPFGSTTGLAGPVTDLLVDVVVIGVVANQLRYGKRWAWWVTVGLGVLNAAAMVLVVVLIEAGQLPDGAPVTLGGGVLWLGELALLLLNRRAFRVPWRRRVPGGQAATTDSLARARTLLTSVGGSTMSWMTLWPEGRFWFTANGHGYYGYQRHSGVAIGLSDPVVPPEQLAATVAEFTAAGERGGLIPCLFSVTDPVARAVRAAGWRTVQIAEDTLIDLPGLEFKGKKWQDVRSALNKARKESIEFRLVVLAEQPPAILAQVRAISEQWVGDKGLPEMGFTLGGVEEALDPAVRVGLAVDGAGSVHGVTSWLPVHAPGGRVRGWTLDVMRRRTDGFRPVMEFMIASACLALRELGAEFVSLSGAPLARGQQIAPDQLDQIDRVLDRLGGALEPFYGFRSLHAFKAKFSPRYEPIHMAFRDEADLPRIGLALTRAYLPDASPRQLLAATMSGRS
jgi:phosphatidylglycerol lysyltransferase